MAARDFDAVVSDVVGLLEAARRAAARSINTILTETYWEIGRRIVEEEQRRRSRSAEYGKALMTRLSADLTERFGRGFGRRSLFRMRRFYLAYRYRKDPVQLPIVPPRSGARLGQQKIVSAVLTLSSSGVPGGEIVQAPPGQSRFPLPWGHYVLLLPLERGARDFYEREALAGGWTWRQLERQIATQFYERSSASRGGKAPRARAPEEGPRDELRDPYVLEFLGLPDDFGESDVEDALIRELETFLLELGGHFAFIGRQRRLRIGDQWHRIDLLLFHRRLRCLVIIDLKLGALTGADTGQMHLYLNYAREHWTLPDENPPVGLILSGKQNAAVAHYALDGLPDRVIAADYRLALPDERVLAERINRSWRLLTARPRPKK